MWLQFDSIATSKMEYWLQTPKIVLFKIIIDECIWETGLCTSVPRLSAVRSDVWRVSFRLSSFPGSKLMNANLPKDILMGHGRRSSQACFGEVEF